MLLTQDWCRSRFVLAPLLLGLLLPACGSHEPHHEAHGHDDAISELADEAKVELDRLSVAVIPWQNSEEQEAGLQELAVYLSETLDIPVEVELAASYTAAVDRLVSGDVQLAALGASTYVQARQRNPEIEPLVVAIDRDSGRPWYAGVMVVRADSGITSLESAAGKRVSFVSKTSTSGFVVPAHELAKMNLVPERHFASVEFSGSHNTSLERLVAGEVDVIFTENITFNRESKPGGLLSSGEYVVAWESVPLPKGPIAISPEVPDALKIELRKALIGAPEGLTSASGSQSAGYTVAEDADYEPIRDIEQAMEQEP